MLNIIKARRLDTLFEYEEKVLGGSAVDRPVLELIQDPDLGTLEDKLRLFLIHYICTDHMLEVAIIYIFCLFEKYRLFDVSLYI